MGNRAGWLGRLANRLSRMEAGLAARRAVVEAGGEGMSEAEGQGGGPARPAAGPPTPAPGTSA
ncbi:AI-2E family transporter, partial [Streptomyces sp. BR123]|nr:AI-2E family transporter [Streptomyces sp. BR123]